MKKILLLAILMWLSTAFASAQISLEVNIASAKDGRPLEGKIVFITNDDIGFIESLETNNQGKVVFTALTTTGIYKVYVNEDEEFEREETTISLNSNQSPSITLFITEKVAEDLEGTVINVGSITKINTINAEVSSDLNEEQIRELPIEGRDISRALYRLPNISRATGFYPEAPNVSINGANSLYTNYLIDGMDNNENFLGGMRFAMPVGFVQNISVLTNNFSPEFGLTSNGVINVTTKSGTNTFKGEVFYVTRPGPSIDGKTRFAQRDLSGNFVKDGFQRQQGGFGFGGAIKPNKTFYYLNFEHTTDYKDNRLTSPQLGVNEIIKGTNNFSYLSGKLDHHWNDKLTSSLRLNYGIVNIERQGGGLDGGATFPSAGNKQDRNSLNIASKNTYRKKNFISETNLQYSTFLWDYARPIDDKSPNVTVLDPNNLTVAILGHPGYLFKEEEQTTQFQQKFSWKLKEHILKTGVEVKSSNYSLFGGGNPNGSYTVRLNQAQLDEIKAANYGADLSINNIPANVEVLNYSVELRQNAFEAKQNIYSFYLEDLYSVSSRLNVNVGLRYDYDDLSKGASNQGDMNNIAPRVSFNYKLTPKSALRGGYGLFYDKILYALYSDALQFNNNSADYKRQVQQLINLGVLPEGTNVNDLVNEGNLGGSFANASYLNGPSASTLEGQRENIFSNELRVINPNGYDNPYSHQFTLGYQYQVNKNTLFYVDAMHNQSYNLFRVRNLNAPAAYPIDPNNVVVRSDSAADLTRPVPIYTDGTGSYTIVDGDTLRGVARNVVMTESAGRSRYYAMSFNLQKDKGEDNYAYRIIYTLSLLENNTEDINFRAMDGNNFKNEWGPSINDRTHMINAIYSYYPHKNFSATVAALLQSGQPINRIPDASIYGTTDLNGDGRAFGDAYVGNSDRSPGEDRNSDRLPWSNTFDVGLQYQMPFDNGAKVQVRADVFNVFNAENLSGYSNNATQSNQIQVGAISTGTLVRRNAGPPRQFQFTARYVF